MSDHVTPHEVAFFPPERPTDGNTVYVRPDQRRAFDLPRIARACQAVQSGIRCTTYGDDASVAGGALRELMDALHPMDAPLTRKSVQSIQDELGRAIVKHGRNNTPLWCDRDNGVNLAVLVEEVGEVARAMTYDEGDRDQLRRELIQVAAMSAAWAQALGEGAA